jgi:uncharacterized protein (TIGR02001 family)
MKHLLCTALPVLVLPTLFALPPLANAQLTGNVALTTNYKFRGQDQDILGKNDYAKTRGFKPAVQGGFDYAFGDSGFYVGTWGSNVDFGDGTPDIEIDTYVGWNTDLTDSLNFDVMLTRYNYFGASDDFGSIDYNELIGALTWNEMLTFTAAYTNDYSNSGVNASYLNLTGEWPVGDNFTFTAGVGRSEFEDFDGYTDWTIGVSHDFGPVNAALNYYDTNIDLDGERLSDALVLTFTIDG